MVFSDSLWAAESPANALINRIAIKPDHPNARAGGKRFTSAPPFRGTNPLHR
jgi:hypothetical protein